MPKLNNIDYYALIDTLVGKLKIEYELQITDNHITIKTAPAHYQKIHDELKTALSDVASILPYSVEVAPLEETLPEALTHFKALLGQDRFADIAINPDELFNANKGAQVIDGVLYSKPTTNKKAIAVWTDAVKALTADLSKYSAEQLKILWRNGSAIARESVVSVKDEMNYHDIVKQNIGLSRDENSKVRVFFNFRQLWQDLFVPELAVKSKVIQAPAIKGSRKNAQLTIDKSHLLDYLRQELQSDVLWRIFQTEGVPVATPLYLDTTYAANQKITVSIIIDRSGSMQNMFDALTNNILDFVKKLQPHVKVNILFFDNTIGPRKSFRAHEIKDITAFVKSLKPKGGTYLYKALSSEIAELMKEARGGDNTAVMLLTDGADASPNAPTLINDILQKQQHFRHDGLKAPKIFTVGIGHAHQIQQLDERLESEGLIIKSVAEFDKVFKYIHEIQYPSIEHTLALTTKPEQVDAFKVTYPQDNHVHSPDIYVPFVHDVMGVIGNHYKQIIRLNGKHLPATVHDKMKGILARTRQEMTSKPQKANAALESMKEMVVKFSKETQAPYEKSALARLVDLMEQSQHEALEDIHFQKRVLEQKASVPSFSMNYQAQISPNYHTTAYDQALPAPSYNAAGKLISDLQQPLMPSLPAVRLNTNFNHKQNHMTVHGLDNTQAEQKRFYAVCRGEVDEFNEAPFLSCQADTFQSFVFPHDGNIGAQGDHYDLSSCRAISYFGRPSMTCEGENSSVVITPHLEARPFENLNANIALGAVFLHWGKLAYDWFTASGAKVVKEYISDAAIFNQKMKELSSFLDSARKKLDKAKNLLGAQFYQMEIEDYQDELKNCERQFLNGTLEKCWFSEFYDELKSFKEEIHQECECLTNQPQNKPVTPMLALERQRDWGALIEHKPIEANLNCPRM